MPKVYLCDTGLVNHLVKLDLGLLFENSIFQNLRQKGELNYYKKKKGIEIDFILNKKLAYEVKLFAHLSDIKKLQKISNELNLEGFQLISKNYIEHENVIYGFMV